MAARFWLAVECSVNHHGCWRPTYFLCPIFFVTDLMTKPPPTHSSPATPPLNNTFYCGRQLLVDCCVFQINGSHLRPTPISSLCFWTGLCLAPQTGELTASSAQLVPAPCVGTLVATARWVRGRGQSRWGIGWWRLLLVAVCFCVLCCGRERPLLLATKDTYFVKSWYRIGQNGWFFVHA